MATARVAWLQVGDPIAARVAWLQIDGAPAAPATQAARVSWLQIDGTPLIAAPNAPGAATGVATGATTYSVTVPDTNGGTAAYRVQVREDGGAWADAVGATNPMPAGTLVFNGTGATPAALLEVQVRAERSGINSAYVPGAAGWYQDNAGTGGGELGGYVTAAVAATGLVGGTAGVAVAVSTPETTAAVAATGSVLGVAAIVASASWQEAGATVAASGSVFGAAAIAVDVPAVLPTVAAQVGAVGVIAGAASMSASVAAPPSVVDLVVAASGQVSGLVAALASVFDVVSPPPAVVGGVAKLQRWPDKDPRETTTIAFTFPGLVSDVLMDVDAYSQYGENDPDPKRIFAGDLSVDGNVVTRAVGAGGVDLVDYYVDCVATVAGQRLVAALVLPVRTK